MPKPVLFIDDGDVMNENERRGPQWQRLVGQFFAPLLGGTPARWAEANRVVAPRLWDAFAIAAVDRVDADYEAFARAYELAWLHDMCQEVGVPVPAAAESRALARRANAFVCPRVDAAYPGVVDAIRALHARGYQLHTASGEESSALDGYLVGMGVRECFGRLHGADLVCATKSGPTYYARVFADARVAPAAVLVVDNSPAALAWAAQIGAKTALVGPAHGDHEPDLRIAGLADLPSALSFRAGVTQAG